MSENQFEDLPSMTRQEAEAALASADLEEVRRATAALASVADWQWAEARLATLSEHADRWVAGNAVVAMGDMVRLGHPVDVEQLRHTLQALADSRPELAGRVESTLEDLDIFGEL